MHLDQKNKIKIVFEMEEHALKNVNEKMIEYQHLL
jgi:hypothetical protein